MYALKQITPPAEAPVTLAEAKQQCGVASGITYHDTQLAQLINAATHDAQTKAGRAIISAEYRLTLDRFPRKSRAIEIPLPPLQSIDTFTYLDAAGDSQAVSASVYKVLTDHEPGRIVLKDGQVWPASLLGEEGVVVIEFTAGYADDAASLSENEELLKSGILLAVEALWRADDHQVYERLMRAANLIFQQYNPGDEFVAYGVA